MRTFLLCLILFSAIAPVSAQKAYTLGNIPEPTPPSSYVSNPDGIISAAVEARINSLLRQLEDSTTSQVAVVVVNSIGGEVPRDFGLELFRDWGIGQKENDNGLLIFLVIDQRRMEFITGYGLEGVMPDILCKRIQELYMVPLAKEGDISGATMAGVEQVMQVLMDPNYRQELYADAEANAGPLSAWRQPASGALAIIAGVFYFLFGSIGFAGRKKSLKKAPDYVKHQANDTYLRSKFALLNVALPVGLYAWQEMEGVLRMWEFLVGAYGVLAILLMEKRFRVNRYIFREYASEIPQETYRVMQRSHNKGWLFATVFFPVPFLFYSIVNRFRLRGLRYTAPVSADGVTAMSIMDEKTDDGFLEAYQLIEEKLKSVDYDVWQNPVTQERKIFRFENLWSKYKECPSCKSKTFYMSKNVTLQSPSYTSTGLGEKTYTCKACQFQKQEQYTIAKLTKSSSSSGGGGFSGGGGGGFGGGSSGGGGAGSSW